MSPRGSLESLVEIAGDPAARPIILLHGIGVTKRQWSPQMSSLAPEHRLIATDLPGHGAHTDTRFTFERAARHVTDVIDSFTDGRAIVAGISLGGYVAMEVAARSPERVAGLALTGCSGNPRGMRRAVPAGMALMSRLAGERWLSSVNGLHYRGRYGEELGREQAAAGFSASGARAAFWQIRGRDYIRRLKAYDGPVAIINGERDSMFRLGELIFLSAARDATLQLVPRAGHVANLEQPAAYDRALRRFVRSIQW